MSGSSEAESVVVVEWLRCLRIPQVVNCSFQGTPLIFHVRASGEAAVTAFVDFPASFSLFIFHLKASLSAAG